MSSVAFDIGPLVDASFNRLADVGIQGLSSPERTLVCIWALLGEVDNGGFDQWLFNTSGDWTQETLEALLSLGAGEAAELVRSAMGVFPFAAPSPDLEERRAQMNEFSEADDKELSSLDKSFYEIEAGVVALLYEYAEAHKAEIL